MPTIVWDGDIDLSGVPVWPRLALMARLLGDAANTVAIAGRALPGLREVAFVADHIGARARDRAGIDELTMRRSQVVLDDADAGNPLLVAASSSIVAAQAARYEAEQGLRDPSPTLAEAVCKKIFWALDTIFGNGSSEVAAVRAQFAIEYAALRAEYPHQLSTVQSPLTVLVDPGSAPPEEIADYLAELSTLYRMVGGSGITFTLTDVRQLKEELV